MSAETKMGGMPPRTEIDTSTYSGRVAQRMRDLRTAKGWTVADLLARVNRELPMEMWIAQPTLHGWDRGLRKIDPDYYPAIAKALSKSVKAFLPTE